MREYVRKNLRLSTMQIIAAGFLGVILLGGILLSLPFFNNQPITFTDALFTSTTAVCVTGLVTIVPAVQFNLAGQIVLLILIQIGGFGVIACSMAFLVLLKKRITVRERIVIQQTYDLDRLSGMVQMILKVIKGTFVVEGIGMLLFAFQFVPEFGIVKGLWYALFHAVSGFCNAGIDIIGDSSFVRYATNPLISITTMALIVVGGIGFIVWDDIIKSLKNKKRSFFRQLMLHSKVALTMTVIMIVLGAVLIYLFEFRNGKTIGEMSGGSKIMASFFQSVTTRTAGYATIMQGDLTDASKLITCIWMLIGGSPGGTAGGIKTTTVAMLFLTCITVISGKKDTECFGRRIPSENIRTGISVIVLAGIFLLIGTLALMVLEPGTAFLDVLLETTSAIGTVGLSAGLTPELSTAAKYVDIILMYIGRIGPVTIALAFGSRPGKKHVTRDLPEKRIMIG